jgi:hypothetical protein
MHILLIIGMVIGALILVLLLLAFVSKKTYSVERNLHIHKPVPEVFGYIKYLKNQDHFSKWATMDPVMKKRYSGTDGTPGFISAWESNNKNVGTGEQEIKKITENEKVDFELRFLKPFPGVANAYMETQKLNETSTNVKWGFQSSMKFPLNIMLLFMNMDKMIGTDFETGLQNLKNILEK